MADRPGRRGAPPPACADASSSARSRATPSARWRCSTPTSRRACARSPRARPAGRRQGAGTTRPGARLARRGDAPDASRRSCAGRSTRARSCSAFTQLPPARRASSRQAMSLLELEHVSKRYREGAARADRCSRDVSACSVRGGRTRVRLGRAALGAQHAAADRRRNPGARQRQGALRRTRPARAARAHARRRGSATCRRRCAPAKSRACSSRSPPCCSRAASAWRDARERAREALERAGGRALRGDAASSELGAGEAHARGARTDARPLPRS